MHISKTICWQFEVLHSVSIEQTRVDTGVLVYRQRAVGAVGRDDQTQATLLLFGGEVLLLVARVTSLRSGTIQICKKCTISSREALYSLWRTRCPRSSSAHRQGGLPNQCPSNPCVRVCLRGHRKKSPCHDAHGGQTPFPAQYAVFVDHQQVREPHVLRVIVTAEGKAVLRAQPADWRGRAQRQAGVPSCPYPFTAGWQNGRELSAVWLG